MTFLYNQTLLSLRARDQFISIVTHELKTPMTVLDLSIQNAKNVLKTKINDQESAKATNILVSTRAQIQKLVRLVDDLFDVSHIHAGVFSFLFELVNLSRLVGETADRFKPLIDHAHCKLEIVIQEGVFIECDRTRIEQLLENLIGNAIKYGRGSPIRISLESVNRQAQIIIEDNGPGIAIHDHRRLFEPYERLESSQSGLGLGLFIVKEIVQRHNGTIKVESDLNRGAKFIVVLPQTIQV